MEACSVKEGQPVSLWDAFQGVPGHRDRSGRRYPLAGLLVIAVAALLSGRQGQIGIKRWGEKLSPEALASLGITRGRVPTPSVWCEFFKKLDVEALEQVLAGLRADSRPVTPRSTANACVGAGTAATRAFTWSRPSANG